jgi:hypothetical protein
MRSRFPAGPAFGFELTQGLRPGLIYAAPSGLGCGDAFAVCDDRFSVRGSRFSVWWVRLSELWRFFALEIHVSHPLHRTQRVGHPAFLVVLAVCVFDLMVRKLQRSFVGSRSWASDSASSG